MHGVRLSILLGSFFYYLLLLHVHGDDAMHGVEVLRVIVSRFQDFKISRFWLPDSRFEISSLAFRRHPCRRLAT